MNMTGEVRLALPRTVVWKKLNDPRVLQRCIPGCDSLERDGDGFAASVKLKVGPISARFKGRVSLTDLEPPASYKIIGEGEGGIAGYAKGSATVTLSETHDGECLLVYDVNAAIGGKMAQLGSRMIDGVAKKNADQFFETFRAIAAEPG
jgi:uncharacterized protein